MFEAKATEYFKVPVTSSLRQLLRYHRQYSWSLLSMDKLAISSILARVWYRLPSFLLLSCTLCKSTSWTTSIRIICKSGLREGHVPGSCDLRANEGPKKLHHRNPNIQADMASSMTKSADSVKIMINIQNVLNSPQIFRLELVVNFALFYYSLFLILEDKSMT